MSPIKFNPNNEDTWVVVTPERQVRSREEVQEVPEAPRRYPRPASTNANVSANVKRVLFFDGFDAAVNNGEDSFLKRKLAIIRGNEEESEISKKVKFDFSSEDEEVEDFEDDKENFKDFFPKNFFDQNPGNGGGGIAC